jgi:hypothetical protein
MRRILLIEPAYRNKYPPLGLMKISTYHKLLGDYVEFVKGLSPDHRKKKWDRIYVATLFTFYWRQTINTIKYYSTSVPSPESVYVGGVMATLAQDDLRNETGATVFFGLLDRPQLLDADNNFVVDHMIPDYGMLDEIGYKYPASDAYIGYATRGCPNRCAFCAVPTIEPGFCHYTPLARQLHGIEDAYGTKKDLLLLDNNILASRRFKRIVHDIRDLGFQRGAKHNNQLRSVDFNQGLDARKLDAGKMKLLATLAIRPIRFALDNMGMAPLYREAVRLAAEYEVTKIGTYVLFNFREGPRNFYDRLRLNITLNEELGICITSFPMKYAPLDCHDRSHVGPRWNRRLLRGIQCVLLATRGQVSPNPEFFYEAFGETYEKFVEIMSMPEHYVIHRHKHKANGAAEWTRLFGRLTQGQRTTLYETLDNGPVTKEAISKVSGKRLVRILEHYLEEGKKSKTRK